MSKLIEGQNVPTQRARRAKPIYCPYPIPLTQKRIKNPKEHPSPLRDPECEHKPKKATTNVAGPNRPAHTCHLAEPKAQYINSSRPTTPATSQICGHSRTIYLSISKVNGSGHDVSVLELHDHRSQAHRQSGYALHHVVLASIVRRTSMSACRMSHKRHKDSQGVAIRPSFLL